MKDAKFVCSCHQEERIDWSRFLVDWVWQEIKDVVQGIAKSRVVTGIYVGVTSCPWWRYEGCRQYQEHEFLPHADRFDRMFMVCVDRFEAVHVMEECLIEMLFDSNDSWKVKNNRKYSKGPVTGNFLFLYCCVNYHDAFSL